MIAILLHLLILLLFKALFELAPERLAPKKQENRIKVALKEKPESPKKVAPIDNNQKPLEKAPPMPKGKQLEKLPEPSPKVSKEPAGQKQKPAESVVTKNEPEIEAAPPVPKKTVATATKKNVADVNETKPVKQTSALYAALSKKQKAPDEHKKQVHSGTHVGSDFKEAYGETFGTLSEGEKKYIIDNQEIMRRITQEQLNRLGPVNIPRNLSVNTGNIIEFYLHPNGDISGLRIVTASGVQILDDTSLQTIEYSYHRYPLPKQKTRVRYKVGYYLGGRPH